MNASDQPSPCYRMRIRDHLDPPWSDWFVGLSIALQADGTTTLTGHLNDQAELFGVLARLRDLGATLLAVETVAEAADVSGLKDLVRPRAWSERPAQSE